MTLNDIEEYSLKSIAVLGGNMYSQITVGNVTLPKAVLSTVKIFAVRGFLLQLWKKGHMHTSMYIMADIHCKYFDCTQYSFWQCYMCHCNLAVYITV